MSFEQWLDSPVGEEEACGRETNLVEESVLVTTGSIATGGLHGDVDSGSRDGIGCGQNGRLERHHFASRLLKIRGAMTWRCQASRTNSCAAEGCLLYKSMEL